MLIHFKKIFGTKWVVWTLSIIGMIAGISIIFFSGMVFGNHRADYRCAFGDRYEKMFFGEKGNPMMPGFNPKEDIRAFGASGKIISIASSTIIVADLSGAEKIISTDAQTQIKSGTTTTSLLDLKVGQNVTVFGGPAQDGSITARLVRVMPEGFKMMLPQEGRNYKGQGYQATSTVK